MSKLLIINGSPRRDGVDAAISKMIADDKNINYETEIVNVAFLNINACKACMSCKKTGGCAQIDDMCQLYDKIRNSDALILAAPIYFGAECAQMKTFIDRLYAMISIKDGKMSANIGNVKKASILLTCGAPDGNMKYGGVLARLTNTVKSMGVLDFSGSIVCGVSPEQVGDSKSVKDYIEALEFQLEM